MKKLLLVFIIGSLLSLSGCEKSTNIDNTTSNAKITGFVFEKCMCCWGWVITVNSHTIKADSIPGLSPYSNMIFPINAKITIGDKTRSCSEYGSDNNSFPDYYQIKSITIIK